MPIKIKNKKESRTLDLYVYGEISSEKWFEDDITPNDINYINSVSADLINVYINSPGGDVFAGITIKNILTRHEALIRVVVDGIAASIASVILQAGDERLIYNNGMVMVHNPMGALHWAYSEDFRKYADDLDKVRDSIINTYKEKTKINNEKIIKLMDEETYMTAQEAYDYGFVDNIIEENVSVSVNEDLIIFNSMRLDRKKHKNLFENRKKIKEFKPKDDKSESDNLIKALKIYENKLKINKTIMDASS